MDNYMWHSQEFDLGNHYKSTSETIDLKDIIELKTTSSVKSSHNLKLYVTYNVYNVLKPITYIISSDMQACLWH